MNIKSIVQNLLGINRFNFKFVLKNVALDLDYKLNKEGVDILKAIFIDREYADYFPFYEKATVVDVGAHWGYFSLFANMNLHSDARIFSLEPSALNFEILQKNLKRNGVENVKPLRLALNVKNGESSFYLHTHQYNHSLFSSSEDERNVVKVQNVTLKNFIESNDIEHIDFMKMDCEGAEYPILLGADIADLQSIKTISIEFHDLRTYGYRPNQLIVKLSEAGFKIVKFEYSKALDDLNFGKIIATKLL